MNNPILLATMQRIKVKPEKWVQNGYSLGFWEGKPVFLQGAIPGEEVEAVITKETKNHSFAYVFQILQRDQMAGERIPSDCHLFGACGGCQYRHIPYEKELELKLEQLASFFPDFQGRIPMVSGPHTGYRNNVQWHKAKDHWGPVAWNSNRVLELNGKECRLLPLELQLSSLVEKGLMKNQKKASFRSNGNSVKSYDKETQSMSVLGKTILLPKGSFFQTNSFLIDPWAKQIQEWIPKGSKLLELFCGSGTLGVLVADQLGSYQGYEIDALMVSFAKKNFLYYNKPEFQCETFDLFAQKIPFHKFDICLLNPPRNGAEQYVTEMLLDVKPKRIIYSSCHAATLARDWKQLSQSYEIKKLICYDFFPRTSHFEALLMAEHK